MIRICIVDDEYYFRQAMKKYIGTYSTEFEVCGEVNNGEDGLKLILESKPDIALVDITMATMNGLELIAELKKHELVTKVVILTGYGRFEYAKKAISLGVVDYLLKPIKKEELYESLKKVSMIIQQEQQSQDSYNQLVRQTKQSVPRLKELLLQKLIKGNFSKEVDQNLAEDTEFDMKKDYYAVALCRVGLPVEGKWSAENLNICNYAVENMIREMFEESINLDFCLDDEQNVCIIIGMERCVAEYFHDMTFERLTHFQDIVEEKLSFTILISLGTPYNHISGIHDSYKEAYSAQEYALLQGKKKILYYTESHTLGTKSSVLSNEVRRQLSMLMRQSNIDELAQYIHFLFSTMKEKNLAADAVRAQVNDLLDIVLEFYSEYSFPLKNIEIFTIVNRLKSIDELEKYTLQNFTKAVESIHNRYVKNKSTLAKNIKTYIDLNFSNSDLKVEKISEVFFVNLQYLCFIFKKEMKETVGEYIFQVRMQYAKILLDRREESIAYIAEKCGYTDANYFSKCFKKYYGISPKKYLLLNVAKQSDGELSE